MKYFNKELFIFNQIYESGCDLFGENGTVKPEREKEFAKFIQAELEVNDIEDEDITDETESEAVISFLNERRTKYLELISERNQEVSEISRIFQCNLTSVFLNSSLIGLLKTENTVQLDYGGPRHPSYRYQLVLKDGVCSDDQVFDYNFNMDYDILHYELIQEGNNYKLSYVYDSGMDDPEENNYKYFSITFSSLKLISQRYRIELDYYLTPYKPWDSLFKALREIEYLSILEIPLNEKEKDLLEIEQILGDGGQQQYDNNPEMDSLLERLDLSELKQDKALWLAYPAKMKYKNRFDQIYGLLVESQKEYSTLVQDKISPEFLQQVRSDIDAKAKAAGFSGNYPDYFKKSVNKKRMLLTSQHLLHWIYNKDCYHYLHIHELYDNQLGIAFWCGNYLTGRNESLEANDFYSTLFSKPKDVTSVKLMMVPVAEITIDFEGRVPVPELDIVIDSAINKALLIKENENQLNPYLRNRLASIDKLTISNSLLIGIFFALGLIAGIAAAFIVVNYFNTGSLQLSNLISLNSWLPLGIGAAILVAVFLYFFNK